MVMDELSLQGRRAQQEEREAGERERERSVSC